MFPISRLRSSSGRQSVRLTSFVRRLICTQSIIPDFRFSMTSSLRPIFAPTVVSSHRNATSFSAHACSHMTHIHSRSHEIVRLTTPDFLRRSGQVCFSAQPIEARTYFRANRLTARSTRTQPALATSTSYHCDYPSSLIFRLPVGPVNCFR
jgi:hypothetical protein